MPPRKKGHSNNNKKKGRNAKSSRQPATNAPPPAAARGGGTASRAPMLPGETPDFSGYKERAPLSENYGTMYTRYKAASNRFYEFMMNQTPEDVRGKPCVNALAPAADWMLEQQFSLPKSVLSDLKMSIRIRSRVAKSVFGGGDEGHKYFLSVLLYCWTVLVVLPRSESVRQTHDESAAGVSNRYAVFEEEIDDDDDEEEDGKSDFLPSSPVARPEPQPDPMTLEELLVADDRHDATLFLLTLDELMGFVSQQYEALMKNYKIHTGVDGITSTALVETVLEAAVTTNMAIQQVHALEMALQEQHPHLSTPYRVLSAMVLPEVTLKVTGILKEHAAKKCSEQEILAFLGDCLECGFRSPSDTLNRKDSIASDFCADFNVDAEGRSELENVISGIHHLVVVEVPIGEMEKTQAKQFHQEFATSPHSWFRSMDFIGGRAIHHTIRLLQSFGAVIQSTAENQQITPLGGLFGAPWRPGRSRTTHGDLDDLFLSEIMTQWVLMCRKGIIGRAKLPFEHELCPLFVALRDYVESPGKPVSWSLAFSMHAMLISILETDTVFEKLTVLQKSVFDKYFDNVEWAFDLAQSEKDFCRRKVFVQNMFQLSFLRNLGIDAFDDRALWNPLCGGTILSYVAYFGNLEAGCTLVDCHAQLRITLHLFNALLVNGFMAPGQVPFLDALHETFKSSRGLWEGPLPERGQLVQRFWICFGMNPQDAKRMSEIARRDFQGGRAAQKFSSLLSETMPSWRRRKMNPIDPSELSTSFRRVCNRDFRGVQDNYHTPEQRHRMKGTEIYAFCVRTNDTMDAIDREQQLLALNLPSCGAILEQFVCSLSRVVQWDPLLSSAIASNTMINDKRDCFVVLFAQQLLGAFDFADAPLDYMFCGVPTAQVSASFMTSYFGQINPAKALWFQAGEEG